MRVIARGPITLLREVGGLAAINCYIIVSYSGQVFGDL